MHTILDHKKFLQTLEIVARVSTKHATLPVLQCVRLEAVGEKLVLHGTNLEIGIEGSVSAKTKEGGVVVVPSIPLLQTVSLLSQNEVELKTEGDVLTITTPTSKSSIKTVTAEEFPSIPRVTGAGQTLQGKTFALGVKTAAFAASQSSIKPELGSVYVYQKKEHTLTFVATDSFRLIEKTVPQKGVAFEEGLLIPYKNALEFARVCELLDEDPELFTSENQCALAFKNIYITSRLTTGSFPDYESIIPKEYASHATLLTKDLENALRQTGVFLNKFSKLTVTASKQAFTVASSGDDGNTTDTVAATLEGDEITLNFNQRYIAEVLPHVTDDSITIHFAGIGRPIVIEGVHDKTLRYLVMPMNK